MRHRQPLPRTWMMTDERMGDRMFNAIRRLPRGSGIVVRHYSLSLHERRRLFAAVQRYAASRGHYVVRAGADRLGWREDGVHNGPPSAGGLGSRAVHDWAAFRRARRLKPDLIFVSPIHVTRSHSGAKPMPRATLRAILRHAPGRVIALGGMNARRASQIAQMGIAGWAGIDAWLSKQPR